MIYYYLGEAKILQIASGWRGPDVAFVKNNSLRNSGRPGQVNVLCSWARYFTLSECFSPQKISYLHEVNSWNLRTTSHYYQHSPSQVYNHLDNQTTPSHVIFNSSISDDILPHAYLCHFFLKHKCHWCSTKSEWPSSLWNCFKPLQKKRNRYIEWKISHHTNTWNI